jgi:hypothetical protein
VGGLAHRRVVHAQIVADRADHDLPRVEADADLHLHPVRVACVVRVALERLLHPERGVARPYGVVLVGEWRAEEGHDPVAHHLVDRALVAVDGLHHAFEHGVEKLACLFGIAVGEQLHRALEVGEEHRDLLALAFERSLCRQDLFGKMLGSVDFRHPEALCSRLGVLTGGMGALGTELGGDRERSSTVGAHARQRGRTLLAELRAGPILVLASRARHHEPPGHSGLSGHHERRTPSGEGRCSVRMTVPFTCAEPRSLWSLGPPSGATACSASG